MIRLSIAAATSIALLSAGLMAMPASAAQTVGSFCATNNPDIKDNLDSYAMLLKQSGVDVSNLRQWGGCLQAFVTGADGKTHLAYFDPLTLKEIPFDTGALTTG